MIKDAYEDFSKFQVDSKENNSKTLVYKRNTAETTCQYEIADWSEIRPGDMVKVKDGEMIPADIMPIQCSNSKGRLYVETLQLDGETSLKLK